MELPGRSRAAIFLFGCFSFSIIASAGALETPVAYWSFDENSGDTARDATDKGHDASLDGPEWTIGKFRGALEFDGGADFAEVDDHPDLNFGPDDSFTIAMWAKYSSDVAGTGIASWVVGKAGQLPAHYLFGYHPDGNGFRLKLDDGGTDLKLDFAFNPDDEWHHIAAVRDKDSGEARLFLDGKLVSSKADSTGDTTNDAPLHIGQRGDGGEFMNGVVDELAIWRVALTEDEIAKVMSDGLASILAVKRQDKLAGKWGKIKR